MANGTLLCISGSLRQDSFNTRLVKEAARIFDAQTTLWADLRLPLYDQDLEADGLPDPVKTLLERSGGERAQYMLRHFLVPHGAEVVHGPEVLVGSNFDQFDGDRLINEINLKALTDLMGTLRASVKL